MMCQGRMEVDDEVSAAESVIIGPNCLIIGFPGAVHWLIPPRLTGRESRVIDAVYPATLTLGFGFK